MTAAEWNDRYEEIGTCERTGKKKWRKRSDFDEHGAIADHVWEDMLKDHEAKHGKYVPGADERIPLEEANGGYGYEGMFNSPEQAALFGYRRNNGTEIGYGPEGMYDTPEDAAEHGWDEDGNNLPEPIAWKIFGWTMEIIFWAVMIPLVFSWLYEIHNLGGIHSLIMEKSIVSYFVGLIFTGIWAIPLFLTQFMGYQRVMRRHKFSILIAFTFSIIFWVFTIIFWILGAIFSTKD